MRTTTHFAMDLHLVQSHEFVSNKCINEGSFAFSDPDLLIIHMFPSMIDPVHFNWIIMVVDKAIFDLAKRSRYATVSELSSAGNLSLGYMYRSPLRTNHS